MKKYDFYLASPFFNEQQNEREEFVKKQLREMGYTVFAPKEETCISGNVSYEEKMKAFKMNCKAIKNSAMIIAITDGKDMGTIWECGYGYGIQKPIIYFAETLGKNPFNLMLAMSGIAVFLSRNEFKEENIKAIIETDINKMKPFTGEIE